MSSRTRLPKISASKDQRGMDSSSSEEEDTDSEYEDVDILRIDHNKSGQLGRGNMGIQGKRPRTAYRERTAVSRVVERPWSSTLRQPDPKWGKRLLLRRQSTEEYLDEMSDEMFDRVNRLTRSTAATMSRDADKPVQPYLSPREKKKPRDKQPMKINLDYTLRFKGCHRLRNGDIQSAVNRLYRINSESKTVDAYLPASKSDGPQSAIHSSSEKYKLQPNMSHSSDAIKSQSKYQNKSFEYPKTLRGVLNK